MRTDRALAKPTIATYVSTLLDAALSDDAVFEIGAQLDAAAAALRSHADLRDTLLDDAVPAEARRDIITDVFSEFNPALVTALGVMAERGNTDLLSSVAERYESSAEERLDVVVVDVTTAVPLLDTLRETIITKLSADFGSGAVLREHVDPDIVGGIIMSARGRRIDASITSQLDNARLALSTAHTGGEA